MDIAVILLAIGILIFAAHFFAWLFSFTKIPDVLLLMGVGIIVGPWLGLIGPDFFGEAGGLFAIVVLAIILFEGALDLRWDVLKESWGRAFLLVILNFTVSVCLVGGLIWWLTGMPLLLALMFGALLDGTTSAVVIPLVERLQLGSQTKAVLYLESALSDVLSIVVTIALLTAYQLGEFSFRAVSLDIVTSFIGAGIVGLVGGFAWSILLNHVRHMHNSIFSTPAFVFILFAIAELLHLSGPITALVFGITIGNIAFLRSYLERRHHFLHLLLHPLTLSQHERSFFNEVVFLLQTFFFVFVGLSITFGQSSVLLLGVIITLTIFMARVVVVRLAAPTQATGFDRSIMAVLAPKGLSTAVLATLVAQSGIPGGVFIQDVTYMVILLSTMLASFLVFLMYKTNAWRIYADLLGKGDTVIPPTK